MFEYHYQLSQDHFLQGMERYRLQDTCSWFRFLVKGFCFLVVVPLMLIFLAGFLYYAIQLRPQGLSFLGFFLLILRLFVLLLAGPKVDYWFMMRGWKKSALYNQPITVTLTPEGLQTRTITNYSETPWSAFTKVSRVPDGFLIFHGKEHFHWLPDLSLSGGSLAGVELLLKQSVLKFQS